MKKNIVLLVSALLGLLHFSNAQINGTFTNPILPYGADPHVVSKDGMYFYMHTTGHNLTLWKTKKITDLPNAEKKVIWTPPATGMWSKEIWAPEIHFLKGKWYVYFSADDGDNFHHRIYVIENASADPFQGEWQFKGQIKPATDRWSIDGSVFEHDRQLYFIWSGWEGTVNVAQNIYIAKMKNPYTIDGDRVLISRPELAWETVGDPKVNEGPVMLKGKDKLFIIYSGSGCWTDDYKLGILTASDKADLMNPKSWIKSTTPVFEKSVADSVFAPGHNGFFKSLDGKEDWIIYHANDNPGEGCGGKRKPRIQKILWNADGTPNFGKPASKHTLLLKPTGE